MLKLTEKYFNENTLINNKSYKGYLKFETYLTTAPSRITTKGGMLLIVTISREFRLKVSDTT